MSSLLNATYHIETNGKLKYLKQFDVNSDANGYTIDLSKIQFEGRVGMTNSVKIINAGVRSVWVLFDSHHDKIDLYDLFTYNLKIDPGDGYDQVSLSGECSKISLKSEANVVNPITIILI